ncbi:HAD family hydrolase [Demequina pelophila]|uniref:HAD family hydrolase n=1 Tax=Demequina pelophila TaxID=1638984 RepID=UPI0007807936|nr:haloacid dehalogenase-like hydrolase [Demequina pelophila]
MATIIFDFDGTLALGDGPIDAYVRCVDDEARRPRFRAAAAAERARFENGECYRDAYHAVHAAAVATGVGPEALQAGYLRSRELLATDEAPIAPPAGLGDFLARVAPHADLVLVTNSPETRLNEALESLGAREHLSRVVSGAGKPLGLMPILADALGRGPVLSVGDIFEFDLAPAESLGADTALVGHHPAATVARVTMAAATLAELYPAIEAWAAAAAQGAAPTGTGCTTAPR